MRVLVADPSATRRGVLVQGARRAGARELVRAATLEEALAACEAPFEWALVARELSAEPGWAWLADLREKACTSGRLLVTGTRVTRAEAEALRALGAGAFLLRPCAPEAIAERMLQLLQPATAGETGAGAGDTQREAA